MPLWITKFSLQIAIKQELKSGLEPHFPAPATSLLARVLAVLVRPEVVLIYADCDDLETSLCPLCTSAYQPGCTTVAVSHAVLIWTKAWLLFTEEMFVVSGRPVAKHVAKER
jgi:hypothetical protein